MTDTPWGTHWRAAWRRARGFLSPRLPFVVLFVGIMLLNWGAALWIIHYTHQRLEAEARNMIGAEADYARQHDEELIKDADRTLVELRARYISDPADLALERRGQAEDPGGIAVVAQDGQVLTATPFANTAGWPRLMTRLADSADELAVGDPIAGYGEQMGYVPIARRIVRPDGTFAGIIMMSLRIRELARLAPAIVARDGCLTLMSDDGVVLARTPEVRGTVGIRVASGVESPTIPRRPDGVTHQVSPIDGVDRLIATRQLTGLPLRLGVGVGYDAVFTDWNTMRLVALSTRGLSSLLIILAAFLWYTRRRRARITPDALTTILVAVEHGIRVEARDGTVIAANRAGGALRKPAADAASAEVESADGAILRVDRHDLSNGETVLISTDLTARRAAENRVRQLTEQDLLTGLPNRWHAVARIQRLLTARAGSTRLAALILFDLDAFQDINDTIGLDSGDEVLISVAERLRDLASGRDVVASLGGDEFLLYLDDPDDEAAVLALARQLPRVLARPIPVRGQQVRLGASMGIALYPRDGADVATLFRHADIALSRAKMAGRGTAQRFTPAMMVTFEEHRMMESDLRRALDSDELEICLQPQFSCDTLDVTGFEALARWNHPTRGQLSPAAFIPIAERSGLINPLGLWAIEQACKAAASWRTRHRIAVNVSPSQLRCDTIQEDIRGILRRTQFPAHLLELEVTESVLLDEDQRTLETLHKLRAMDIRVTLDDFGTGYSSLSYLRRFPFDKIKIDKSFIQAQETDRGTKVILEAMIRMCTELGFDVVAEGVETEPQLHELRQLGCREIQGFLLSEPLLPEMVETFLARHGRRGGFAPPRVVTSASG